MTTFVNRLMYLNTTLVRRTPVTRTLRGDEKQFELGGNGVIGLKFSEMFDQGKGNVVRVRGEFELSDRVQGIEVIL